MVFVSLLLTCAAFVLALIALVNIQIMYKARLSLNEMMKIFLDQMRNSLYSNVIGLYLVIFFMCIGTKLSLVFAFVLFVCISYFQHFLWSLVMEYYLIWTAIPVRRISLARVMSENCIITHFTFHKYAYDLLKSEYTNFKDMISDSIDDIKVAFYLAEPSENVSERREAFYNMQRRLFKYKKVDYMEFAEKLDTEEEILAAQARWKVARDPKVRFNLVSRLPWDMPYNPESNLFFKLSTSNFLVIYNFFKTTLVAILLMVVYFLYTIFFFKIQFLKQLSVWFVIGMLYFWLMSGFNFFVKRYQYGKFTSQIQRFWKRANMCFWLIEGFLMLLFFYYYLNSSQEPLYMYDYSAINQEFLVSLHVIGLNVILLSLVIYFMYFTLLRINSNSWVQLNLYLIIISAFVFFSFFIETYQFYYVISVFNERLWVFNEEENLWGVDIDNPILRTKHQYLLVCLIAKYWHFLFIFLSWVFFLIKSFERRKVTYVLFGANLQNMIILYVLNFACYLQWFKWIYRRFFDLPYSWFFINIDNKFIFRLFFEIKLIIVNLISINYDITVLYNVVYRSLSLWGVDSLCVWKFI